MDKYIKNGVVDVHNINSFAKLREYLLQIESMVTGVQATLEGLNIQSVNWSAIDDCIAAGVYIAKRAEIIGAASINRYSILLVNHSRLKNNKQGTKISQVLMDNGRIKMRTGISNRDTIDWEDWGELYVEKEDVEEP